MTDISYDTSFDAIVVLEDWIGPNRYDCKIDLDIETDDGDQQNIAFERCKIMLESIFGNALFINMTNPLIQVLSKQTKQKNITLPTEPLDVIIAGIIYNKLNAIVEGRLNISRVKLRSSQGDNIWVHYDTDFASSFKSFDTEDYLKINQTPWWNRADPSVSDWFEKTKKELKFHMHKSVWEKSLHWNKAESKPASRWKPEIIDGGKKTT